jgi:hypothetical protein
VGYEKAECNIQTGPPPDFGLYLHLVPKKKEKPKEPGKRPENKKNPSELTDGGVDTLLHFSVTKGLGSSAPEPWKLFDASGLTASRTLEQVVFVGNYNLPKFKTILYINQSPVSSISGSILICQAGEKPSPLEVSIHSGDLFYY